MPGAGGAAPSPPAKLEAGPARSKREGKQSFPSLFDLATFAPRRGAKVRAARLLAFKALARSNGSRPQTLGAGLEPLLFILWPIKPCV